MPTVNLDGDPNKSKVCPGGYRIPKAWNCRGSEKESRRDRVGQLGRAIDRDIDNFAKNDERRALIKYASKDGENIAEIQLKKGGKRWIDGERHETVELPIITLHDKIQRMGLSNQVLDKLEDSFPNKTLFLEIVRPDWAESLMKKGWQREKDTDPREYNLYKPPKSSRRDSDAAVRFNEFKIEHFDDNRSNGLMTVKAFARVPGVLTYRNMDGSVRRELVAPEFLRAFDSNGMPIAAKLAGLPVTNEHPIRLIRKDSALREQMQVGDTTNKIKVYSDGKIEVEFEVFDSQTQDDIRSGRKTGVSLGYETRVISDSGEWDGMRFDARQSEPFEPDHLAVCERPRADTARITRFDSEDSIDWAIQFDGCGCPEDGGDCGCDGCKTKRRKKKQEDYMSKTMDAAVDRLRAVIDRMDAKKCPGGYSIPDNKNCKGSTTAKHEGKALGKLGKSNLGASSKARLEQLRAKKAATERRTAKKKVQEEGLPSERRTFSAKAASGKGAKAGTVVAPKGMNPNDVREAHKDKVLLDKIRAARAAEEKATPAPKTPKAKTPKAPKEPKKPKKSRGQELREKYASTDPFTDKPTGVREAALFKSRTSSTSKQGKRAARNVALSAGNREAAAKKTTNAARKKMAEKARKQRAKRKDAIEFLLDSLETLDLTHMDAQQFELLMERVDSIVDQFDSDDELELEDDRYDAEPEDDEEELDDEESDEDESEDDDEDEAPAAKSKSKKTDAEDVIHQLLDALESRSDFFDMPEEEEIYEPSWDEIKAEWCGSMSSAWQDTAEYLPEDFDPYEDAEEPLDLYVAAIEGIDDSIDLESMGHDAIMGLFKGLTLGRKDSEDTHSSEELRESAIGAVIPLRKDSKGRTVHADATSEIAFMYENAWKNA